MSETIRGAFNTIAEYVVNKTGTNVGADGRDEVSEVVAAALFVAEQAMTDLHRIADALERISSRMPGAPRSDDEITF